MKNPLPIISMILMKESLKLLVFADITFDYLLNNVKITQKKSNFVSYVF
jgi:hypothetical protein